MLSDGATTTGGPDDAAAQRARSSGVPVSTIAFGTPSGTVVLGGETLSVPPDGFALRAIADATDLVDEHPGWETTPFKGMFTDEFGEFESLADLFRQIGYDERLHKQESEARMGTARFR